MKEKINGQVFVRAGKELTLSVLDEDIDDIVKFVKLLEKSSLSIDSAAETVKHKIKKQDSGFLGAMMAASLIAWLLFKVGLSPPKKSLCYWLH